MAEKYYDYDLISTSDVFTVDDCRGRRGNYRPKQVDFQESQYFTLETKSFEAGRMKLFISSGKNF